MSEKHLHIVTHNVPFPADYGGVIDVFQKIKTLYALGIKIHLHCFTYDNGIAQDELNKYCEKVFYYKRNKSITAFSFRLPFIVSSRKCAALLANLQKDNYPILLEGIHTTYYLYAGKLTNRKVIVRLYNAEFEYYHHLAIHEKEPLKKLYFKYESKLLKKYEEVIAKKASIAAISAHDVNVYKEVFHAPDIRYLPAFLPYTLAICKKGNGCFCLYHGNLSVNENEKAAEWLLQNVFNDLDICFIVAGKSPSEKLRYLIQQNKHACLVSNPSDKEMQDLIAKAQIHILPSFNNTGVKLKLLNALFNGRHCIVNAAGVEGSGLEKTCNIAESKDDFRMLVNQLYYQPFKEEAIEKRQGLLNELYNNEANAQQLISWLY
jgi:glycosyltransferase involved in cell wall biosynthesis